MVEICIIFMWNNLLPLSLEKTATDPLTSPQKIRSSTYFMDTGDAGKVNFATASRRIPSELVSGKMRILQNKSQTNNLKFEWKSIQISPIASFTDIL